LASSDRDPAATPRTLTDPTAGAGGGAPGGRPRGGTRIFDALQFREFRLLWLGRTGSSVSFWMEQVASSWLMYQLTNSPLQLGLVQAIRAIPLLVLSPLAGSFADRYGRKTQLIAAQLVNALGATVLGILILAGLVEPWHLYAAGLVTAVAQVFQHPAQLAMIPETVDRARLTNAIGLNSIAFNASRSVGPAVAGGLIALATAGGAFLAQALILMLTTITTVRMRVPNLPSEGHRADRVSLRESTIQGWRYIATNPTIRASMLVAGVSSLLGQPLHTLLPVFARDVLDVGPTGQGLLLTAMGIGALGAGVLIASVGDVLPKGPVMIAGTTILGLALVAFAGSQWFVVSLGLMVVIGVMNPASHALVQTVLQAQSAPEMRARVMAAWQQISVLMTAGGLVAGAMASIWGVQWTVAGMGAACAIGALAILFGVRHVRMIR
jgi:MFS family permease